MAPGSLTIGLGTETRGNRMDRPVTLADVENWRDQRDELSRQRVSGVQEYGTKSGNGVERRVAYKSDAEMAAAIKYLDDQIAAYESPKGPAPNFIIVRGTKGI